MISSTPLFSSLYNSSTYSAHLSITSSFSIRTFFCLPLIVVLDFVLVDKRFRNGIQKSKSMPGADCDSDHNPVVVKMKIRLQRVKKAKKTVKWNVNNLKKSEVRNAYRMRLDQQLQEEKIDGCTEADDIWKRLKDGISTVAEEICGKEMQPKKQNWMNSEILHKMEEGRKCKNVRDEEQCGKLGQEIRGLCRQAKDRYYEDKCKEISWIRHTAN